MTTEGAAVAEDTRAGGRPRIGVRPAGGGKSRQASARLLPGQLEALDALAARLVSTRNEQLRRAVRVLVAHPPAPGELVERRLYRSGAPQFPWIPEPGQKAQLAELAVALAPPGGRPLTVNTLLRHAVAQLLQAEDARR